MIYLVGFEPKQVQNQNDSYFSKLSPIYLLISIPAESHNKLHNAFPTPQKHSKLHKFLQIHSKSMLPENFPLNLNCNENL